jgi:hypothetical protein
VHKTATHRMLAQKTQHTQATADTPQAAPTFREKRYPLSSRASKTRGPNPRARREGACPGILSPGRVANVDEISREVDLLCKRRHRRGKLLLLHSIHDAVDKTDQRHSVHEAQLIF